MELQLFNYNGNNVSFRKENENVFVNASEMARQFNKLPADFLRLKQTEEFINSISTRYGIPHIAILQTVKGGLNNQGTWMHEKLALKFASWLNSDFELWVYERISELMRLGFTATNQTLENLANNPDLLIELATALKTERAEKERLLMRNEAQIIELKKQAPKIEYFNEVLQSKSVYNTNQIAKELGTSAITLNRLLASKKIQYKQNDTWLLYHKYQNRGYTKTKTHPYTGDNGEIKTSMLTVWTEAGRLFIHQVFESYRNNLSAILK